MTRTLGDITNELKEKVLSPAKEEAEKIVKEAHLQADKIISEAKKEATRIREEAKRESAETIRQMEAGMSASARDFVLLVQERLEAAIIRPVIDREVKAVLDQKDFLASIIDTLIREFAKTQGRENNIELLLPMQKKEELEKWFIGKFQQRAAGGLTVHFTDKVSFGFKMGLNDEGAYFDFGEGLVEIFSEFCSPRFRKCFYAGNEVK